MLFATLKNHAKDHWPVKMFVFVYFLLAYYFYLIIIILSKN